MIRTKCPVGKRDLRIERGKELGVRYVLEGSVQRDQNRVRTNAQLIDTETVLQPRRRERHVSRTRKWILTNISRKEVQVFVFRRLRQEKNPDA